jgi:hypothetical protein
MNTTPGSVMLKNVNISLGEVLNYIKKSLPVGIRWVSPNGREYYSQYFILEKKEYVTAKDSSERYYARMLVLNSSRPFDIQVEVRRQVRQDGSDGHIRYVDDGYDLSLGRMLKDQLKERLAKRRDDLNMIDDFRVF